MKHTILLVIILLISVVYAFPKPVGYVNDFANILTDVPLLEQELTEYGKNTTIEIAVVTIDKLPEDQTLATYAVELFQEWGIGKKGKDNGVLVLIVKNGTPGNRMRIELGYGVQGYITGAEAGRILDEALPFYTQGDYQKTAETILMGLSDQLENYTPGNNVRRSDFYELLFTVILFNLPLIIFVLIIIVSVALRNRCPYCFGKLKCNDEYCLCVKCRRRFRKNRRYFPYIPVAGGSHGGGGGGFGGFGGGTSGGGGAGR